MIVDKIYKAIKNKENKKAQIEADVAENVELQTQIENTKQEIENRLYDFLTEKIG